MIKNFIFFLIVMFILYAFHMGIYIMDTLDSTSISLYNIEIQNHLKYEKLEKQLCLLGILTLHNTKAIINLRDTNL
jgi:hypothetical protein